MCMVLGRQSVMTLKSDADKTEDYVSKMESTNDDINEHKTINPAKQAALDNVKFIQKCSKRLH